MGVNTLKVPMKLHEINRKRLCEALAKAQGVPHGTLMVLQGGNPFQRYDTDVDLTTFRQVVQNLKLDLFEN